MKEINAQIKNLIYGRVNQTSDYAILMQVQTEKENTINIGGFPIGNLTKNIDYGTRFIANLFDVTDSLEWKEIEGKFIRLIVNDNDEIVGIKGIISNNTLIFEEYFPKKKEKEEEEEEK